MIYSSERRFEVWRWGVGHAALLLRSNAPSANEPRIEVLFKPAYVVCLPSLLEGLTIEEGPDEAMRDEVLRVAGRRLQKREHFYQIRSGSASGWVIGGGVSSRQDREDYSAPTMFDGWAPREGVVSLFGVNTG